jgi:nucleoside-diphosphate-sugar epimerase
MKKVLITGAEGFIGSHIVEKFIKLKTYKVYAMVLYNSFGDIGNLNFIKEKNSKNLKIFFGDLKDENTYFPILKKCDFVINLASLISVNYSYIAEKSYFENNIIGAVNLFRLCRHIKIKKIIHFSSSEVYGTPKKIPITENFLFNPQSPYAASKASVDFIAKSFFYSYDLPVVILRPFNNFGPRQSNRAVIPTIINQIMNSNKIILGNINTKRDFLYVEDTVDAVIKCLNAKNNILGEEINIGTNHFFTIKQIVIMIKKIFNKNIKIVINQKKIRPKNSEVQFLLCDYTKATKKLKWTPKYFGKKKFIKALNITIRHYLNNKKTIKNNFI